MRSLLSGGDGGYVGIYTLIPIEEALNVNYVAFLESANGGVNLGVGAGKVGLYAEVIGSAVVAEGDIDVIAGLVVLVGHLLDGQSLEGNKLVLVVDQLVLSQKLGGVKGNGDEAALFYFKGGVDYLNFA